LYRSGMRHHNAHTVQWKVIEAYRTVYRRISFFMLMSSIELPRAWNRIRTLVG